MAGERVARPAPAAPIKETLHPAGLLVWMARQKRPGQIRSDSSDQGASG
jgi:hypothetical protein